MSRKQRAATKARKESSSRLLRILLPLLIGLAAVVVGINVYWTFSRPTLEPLPAGMPLGLEPAVHGLLERARGEVEARPRDAMAWGDLGAAYRAHELGPEAELCFRNAQKLDGTDYRWPYLLGVSLAPSDPDQALVHFRQAAERSGDKPHVLLRLAEMLIERRLMEEAAPLVEKVLAGAPSMPRAELAKARLLFAEGKVEEAKSWAERSAAKARDRRAPHLLLAQLCRRTGDQIGEARELSILADIPDGVTPWEDPDVAAVLALRQAPVDASAALEFARLQNQEQNYSGAEATTRAELKRFPSDERLQFELGIACFQQKKYEAAASAFRRVVEIKADHADAHYNLGHALLKLDQKEEAQAAFAAAVRLHPSHAFARINLADLLLQAGNIPEAREHINVASRLAPNERRVHELMEQLQRGRKSGS